MVELSTIINYFRILLQTMINWVSNSFLHTVIVRAIYLPSIVRMMILESPKHRWYDRVDDTVILGALPLRSHTDKLVKEEKVRAVLTFNQPFELQLFTNSTEEWKSNGVAQHIFPTPDYHPPSLDSLQEGVKIISNARRNKQTVYIHCKAGKGRSAVMTTCYLMSRYKLTLNDAIDFLERKRPQIRMNEQQIAAATEYHRTLFRSHKL